MKTVVDKASSRGYFNHGWLKTHHTFSFANYYVNFTVVIADLQLHKIYKSAIT